MSEAQVAEEVDRIRKAAVRNHTPEVYKLCYSAVDLTTLSCTDSVESVTEFAGKAVKFYQQFPHLPNVASICIYPPFVETVGVVVDGTDMRITSVAGGFPSSQTFLEVKVLEVAMAVENGADEIDMVINLSMVKDGCWEDVAEDIKAVRRSCLGKVLKVIIECSLLTDEEKMRMCTIVSECGADFIKTSTGFSKGGATRHDVELLRRCSPDSLQVKAAGGIASLEDAEDFISLGATRLGTSRIVKLAMELERESAGTDTGSENY